MTDSHDRPPETYVSRARREIDDLRGTFRKSRLVGVCVIVALAAFAAYKLGLFDKKDGAKADSSEIVKLANQYVDLNTKYQKLQQEQQSERDAEKEKETAVLKQRIADQQREIDAKAESAGTVMVPDPTVYGGERSIPASAIAAWTACVQSSSSSNVSATFELGPFSGGASSSDSKDSCNAILQRAGK